MNHQPLVRKSYRRTDGAEQVQSRAHGKPAGVGVGIDGKALDVFHHHVRTTVFGGAAIQQARDARVIEVRENLPFGLETLDGELVAQPATYNFDGYLLAELMVGANSPIDGPHA